MQCIARHTEFPFLTALGRQFKLSGYTMSAGQTERPPMAAMPLPPFTHTRAGPDGGVAPGPGINNQYALTQAGIFYAGRARESHHFVAAPRAQIAVGVETVKGVVQLGGFGITSAQWSAAGVAPPVCRMLG